MAPCNVLLEQHHGPSPAQPQGSSRTSWALGVGVALAVTLAISGHLRTQGHAKADMLFVAGAHPPIPAVGRVITQGSGRATISPMVAGLARAGANEAVERCA